MPGPASLARPSFLSFIVVALLGASGCWQNGYMAHRGLHYVDDQLVETEPPPPGAYEAYLRARVALERNPPQLEVARGHILDALRWQPHEPQLWTVKAEIEWQAGDFVAAEQALARALELRPGYPEAQRMLAELQDREQGSTATAAASPSASRVTQ